MNAALGIAYPLWLKTRWIVGGMLLYIAVMAVAIQFGIFADAGEQVVGSVGLLMFAMAWILNALIFSPADLAAKGSVFPPHMLVLPLRTRALVAWPMLYGAALITSLWLLLAILVLTPAGIPTRLALPAAILLAVMAWAQAIAWSPFPSPFARVPALILAVCPTAALGSWRALDLKHPHVYWLATAGSLCWLLAAYGFAVIGLSRARKGHQWHWSGWLTRSRIRENSAGVAWGPMCVIRRPFRSAAAAQLWFECRRNVPYLPAMLGLVAIPLLAGVCLQTLNARGAGLMIGSLQVQPHQLLIGILIFIPVLFSTMAGPNLARADFWNTEVLPSFFAVRPVTSRQLITGKLKAAGISAAIGWGIIVLVLAAWAILEASPLNPCKSLLRAWLSDANLKDIAAAILAVVALLLVMWRNIVVGQWPALTGRKWIATVLGLASGLALFAAPGLVGWVVKHPDFKERVIDYLPWLLAAAILMKLTVATSIGWALHRFGLVARRDIGMALAIWLAIAALAFAATSFFTQWSWYTAAAAILVVPLARIGAAPLALHWNRCR